MPAPEWPIELEEGSDFDLKVVWEEDDCSAKDVTGYGGKFQVRNDPDDPSALVTATVANNRITVSGTTGRFDINFPAASVDAIKNTIEDNARFTFDVWPTAASPDVDPKRLLNGPAKYSRSYAD